MEASRALKDKEDEIKRLQERADRKEEEFKKDLLQKQKNTKKSLKI